MIDQIKDLSETELLELKQQAQAVLNEREKAKQGEIIKQIKQLAFEHGLTVEITAAKKESNVRAIRTVEPKYRNPENHSETWSGRGKQPKWVQAALASYSLDQMKIAA